MNLCHLMLGKTSWCRCCTDKHTDAKIEAMLRGISPMCQHTSAAEAVALVHHLQDYGLDARIVDGPCEWNPAHPELKKLSRVSRKKKPVEA